MPVERRAPNFCKPHSSIKGARAHVLLVDLKPRRPQRLHRVPHQRMANSLAMARRIDEQRLNHSAFGKQEPCRPVRGIDCQHKRSLWQELRHLLANGKAIARQEEVVRCIDRSRPDLHCAGAIVRAREA